jgi:hypothetical protein
LIELWPRVRARLAGRGARVRGRDVGPRDARPDGQRGRHRRNGRKIPKTEWVAHQSSLGSETSVHRRRMLRRNGRSNGDRRRRRVFVGGLREHPANALAHSRAPDVADARANVYVYRR